MTVQLTTYRVMCRDALATDGLDPASKCRSSHCASALASYSCSENVSAMQETASQVSTASKEYLIGDRGIQASVDDLLVLIHVVGNASPSASKGEGRPDDQRELANHVQHLKSLVPVVDGA